jgi:endonuclease III related protein
MNRSSKQQLLQIYHRLLADYGEQEWWPGSDPFEVIVGAILTQRVSWKNVELAIDALKDAQLMTPDALTRAPMAAIAELIRPCLFYNEKAARLRAFLDFLNARHNGDLRSLFALSIDDLRRELLSVCGIGEETADAIILYAAGKASFVVDAYTRRILTRLGLITGSETYGELRSMFMQALPGDAGMHNEYHALLVRHGKERCLARNPKCDGCVLQGSCKHVPRAQ